MRTFLGVLALLIIGAFSASAGDEQPLAGLELKGYGYCMKMQPQRQRMPCALLEKPDEENTLYLVIMSEDGSEMLEVVRQDFTTGREETIWRKPVPLPKDAVRYPQQK